MNTSGGPIPLNCPQCGKPLQFIANDKPTQTYLYACLTDGFFELTGERFVCAAGPRH